MASDPPTAAVQIRACAHPRKLSNLQNQQAFWNLGLRSSAVGLSRRSFTALCGGVAALAAAAPVAAEAEGVDGFLDLSARLTGFPAEALDGRFADGLRRALAESGHGAILDGLLLGEKGADFRELEGAIIGAWYSGVLPSATGPVVATLYGALIWAAADFAARPGVCAGHGSWGRPPAPAPARLPATQSSADA